MLSNFMGTHLIGRQFPETSVVKQRPKTASLTPRGPQSKQDRLVLEPLEDRTLLSGFTVNNLSDAGPGSLRDAIAQANLVPGADVVKFAKGLSGTIGLTSGEIAITDDLTIQGPGADTLTLSGSGISRIFNVSGSDTGVSISRLAITDGYVEVLDGTDPIPSAVGGGILNDGASLRLARVTMTGNRTFGIVGAGAAIANLFGASLSISHSNFSKNHATGVYLAAAGAVLNDGGGSQLSIDHSSFTENSATALLGGNPLDPFQGIAVAGAVDNAGGSHAVIRHSTFESNFAQGGSGEEGQPGSNASGGALLNGNTSLLVPAATSTIRILHSTFINNRSLGGDGGDGAPGDNGGTGGFATGGAITVDVDSEAVVIQSNFDGNQAKGGNGGDGGVGANGGDGSFPGAGGGAIINAGGLLAVVGSTFTNNAAAAGDGGDGGTGGNGGNGARAEGGAIFNVPAAFPAIGPITTITASSFIGNMSLGGDGGPGGDGGTGGAGGLATGGALDTLIGEMTVKNGSVESNVAQGGAGGDGANGGDAQGGGIWNGSGGIATLENTMVTGNHTIGGAAGAGGIVGIGTGGGVYNAGILSIKPEDLDKILGNSADICDDLFDNGTCI